MCSEGTTVTLISKKVELKTTACKQVVYWQCHPGINQGCETGKTSQRQSEGEVTRSPARGTMTWTSVPPFWLGSYPPPVAYGLSFKAVCQHTLVPRVALKRPQGRGPRAKRVSNYIFIKRGNAFTRGGSVGKESACNARDGGSIPGSGRSPRGEHDNPLQYSCLENPMARGLWQATVHRVAKSRTRLKRLTTHPPRTAGGGSLKRILEWRT